MSQVGASLPKSSEVKAQGIVSSRTGRFARLVPLAVRHLDFLYDLATNEEVGYRWRFQGTVPSPDKFQSALWDAVLCQFVVVDVRGKAVGHVVAYNPDLHQGWTHVGGIMHPDVIGSGIGLEALDLFVAHLFSAYNLRKVYFEVPEYNLSEFGSLIGPVLEVEARLKGHVYLGGSYWDFLVLALYRDSYLAIKRSDSGRPIL
jgi:RimJ/RimL family protein N-acetyltransferase